MQVTIAGKGFSSVPGNVLIGTSTAAILSWSDTSVSFSVPSAAPGSYNVQLVTNAGATSNALPFTVLKGQLIPVTFTVNNAPSTAPGEAIFLTGNVVELGAGVVTRDAAVGPMLAPNPPTWFIDASVPAGVAIQFGFAKFAADGTVTSMENGPSHSFTVPTSGVGSVTVSWQY